MNRLSLCKLVIAVETVIIVYLSFKLHRCHHGLAGFAGSMSDAFRGR